MFLTDFYEQIMVRLTSNVLEIKHFDLFFNQYELEMTDDKGELPFNRPAVFVEWPVIDFKTLGNKRQAAEMLISFHVVSDVIQDVDKSQPDAIRSLGHKHLILIDNLHKYLQNWNGAQPETGFKGFGSFDRVGLTAYKPLAMMIVHIVTYRVRALDDVIKIKLVKPALLTPPVIVNDEITPEIL